MKVEEASWSSLESQIWREQKDSISKACLPACLSHRASLKPAWATKKMSWNKKIQNLGWGHSSPAGHLRACAVPTINTRSKNWGRRDRSPSEDWLQKELWRHEDRAWHTEFAHIVFMVLFFKSMGKPSKTFEKKPSQSNAGQCEKIRVLRNLQTD